MPKHNPSDRHRRLDLDLLEDRRVLSGGIGVIAISPPPVIVLIEPASPSPYPIAEMFSPSPPSEFHTPWGDRPAGLGHALTPWGKPLWTSGFQGDPLAELTDHPAGIPGPNGSWGGPMPAPAPAISAVARFGSSPPNVAPSTPDMLASLDLYLPRMIPRATADLEIPRERVSPIRPPSGAVFGSPDGRAPDPESGITQNPSDVAHETQGSMPAAGGATASQGSQITSSGNIIPAHLTAFLNPESARGHQLTSIGQPSEASGGQKGEWNLGAIAKLISANLVTAETSRATAGEPIPGGDAQGPPGEPHSVGDRMGSLVPHAAGLIAEVMPFDRASLENAVDQFFDQLEDLGAGPLAEAGPAQVIPLSLTVVGAVAVAEAARRRLRGKLGGGHDARRRDPLGSEDLMGFPELPGSWSTRLT